MKIYVAASSKERPRYRRFLRALEVIGVGVTYNWSEHFDRVTLDGRVPTDADLNVAEEECKRGIDECEVFVMLVPTTPSRGAWFELGYASRGGKKTVSIGDAAGLDCWQCDEHADGFVYALNVLVDIQETIANEKAHAAADFLAELDAADSVAECETNSKSDPILWRTPEGKLVAGEATPPPVSNAAPTAPTAGSPVASVAVAGSGFARSPVEHSPPSAARSVSTCTLALSSLEPTERCGSCDEYAAVHKQYARPEKVGDLWARLVEGLLSSNDADLVETEDHGSKFLRCSGTATDSSVSATNDKVYAALRPFVPADVAILVNSTASKKPKPILSADEEDAEKTAGGLYDPFAPGDR